MAIDLSFLIGQRFGRSVVLAQEGIDEFGLPTWRCHCDRCGQNYIASTNPIIQRFPTPCRCREPRRSVTRQSRGGLSSTREYRVWADLRRRCRAGGNRGRYWDRGIELHSAWADDFDTFRHDVGVAPASRARLDRVDRRRGYVPGNVHWATAPASPASRLNAHIIAVNGRLMTLAEMARVASLRPATLGWRINAGWTVERALSTPPGN